MGRLWGLCEIMHTEPGMQVGLPCQRPCNPPQQFCSAKLPPRKATPIHIPPLNDWACFFFFLPHTLTMLGYYHVFNLYQLARQKITSLCCGNLHLFDDWWGWTVIGPLCFFLWNCWFMSAVCFSNGVLILRICKRPLKIVRLWTFCYSVPPSYLLLTF